MESPIKQLIVLDELRDRMEMIDSDIIPESFSQPVQEGTQNVAANIYSVNGTSYAGNYTTLPLSPLTGNVHMVDKSFIHTQFTLNFNITFKSAVAGNTANTAGNKLRLYVGPRDTASLFSRLQLLMGNDQIFSTDYQQLESAIGLASLPSDVVEHCQQYATIDKLLANKNTPMQLVDLDLKTITAANQYATFNFSLKYDLTIDLNRLAIPLSDIHFITRNMGMLNLRIFFNNMHQSFYYFVVPDGFTSSSHQGLTSIAQLAPIQWGTPMNIDVPGAANADPACAQITFNTLWQTVAAQAQANAPTQLASAPMFFTLEKIAICQSCFEIEHESYEKLEEFFKDNGNKCIIPIHVLNTTLFSNGSISGIGATAAANTPISYPTTLNAQVSNQNISKLFVSQFLANNQSAILNPMFSDFTLYYNGKPVNALPYQKINDRAIADFTSTMLDTDSQEVNNDYLYSMSWGQKIQPSSNCLATDQPASNFVTVSDSQYFNLGNLSDPYNYTNILRQWKGINGWSDTSFKLSHLCPLAFSTGVEGSFQTGLCVDYGAGTGTQQARLVATNPYNDSSWINNMCLNKGNYTIPNARANSTNIALSAYTDACLVLSFDPYRHYCVNGILSYVKPFIRAEI